jgi:hypothetical protein
MFELIFIVPFVVGLGDNLTLLFLTTDDDNESEKLFCTGKSSLV